MERLSDELELEIGGYSRVEHVENAGPRRIRRGSKARLKRTLIWKQRTSPPLLAQATVTAGMDMHRLKDAMRCEI